MKRSISFSTYLPGLYLGWKRFFGCLLPQCGAASDVDGTDRGEWMALPEGDEQEYKKNEWQVFPKQVYKTAGH